MSTEETSTEETVESTEEVTEAVAEETQESSAQDAAMNTLSVTAQLEVKIARFMNLRNAIVEEDKKWTEQHNIDRMTVLEEAGIKEKFLEFDKEFQAHRAQVKANIDPVSACIAVLSEYRSSQIQGTQFVQMETLEKVWAFEKAVFGSAIKAQESAQEAEGSEMEESVEVSVGIEESEE